MPTTAALPLASILASALGGDPAIAYGPGVAGAIPDNDIVGFVSPIVVERSFPITSVAVRINGLTHGYCSDLTIELRRPGLGAPFLLCINIGNGNSADFGGDYTFTDTGANLWQTAQGQGGLWVIPPGDYRASGAGGTVLSLNDRYSGEDAQGTWLLRVVDDDWLVAGAFESWELHLGGGPPCPPGGPAGDLNGDGTVDFADLLILVGQWGATDCVR